MTRLVRGTLVGLGTVAMTAIGLVYPLIVREDAWKGAKWVVWYALFAVIAVPWVVYKMTLGADGREPRLHMPTIAPLLSGPRGLRSKLRDVPGVLRGAALVLGVLAIARPQDVLRGENAEERVSTSSSCSTCPARCAR